MIPGATTNLAANPIDITGYRALTAREIEQVNRIKAVGNEILAPLISELRANAAADQRWVSLGQTHFQEGLMALARAITRPEGF